MKVLGLSFGRKMMNCDIMIKEALTVCKEAGHEIKFMNVNNYDIKPCTGCIACTVSMIMGAKNAGNCVLKDDFHIVENEIMDADAVLLAAPTFECATSGLYRTLCDRLGPSHDITFRKAAIDEGMDVDKRSLKKRVCALMSAGGAVTKNWTDLAIPTMYPLPMSMGMDVVDFIQYYGAMAHHSIVHNTEIMERVRKLGANVVDALNNFDNDEQRAKWRGDDGVCPVCHLDMINIVDDGAAVECVVCGIRGEISMEDGKLKVNYSDSERARSRLTWAGKLEHSTEIKTKAAGPDQIPNLKELLEPYKWE